MFREGLIIFLNIITIVLLINISWSDIKYRIIANKIVIGLCLVFIILTGLKYETLFILTPLFVLLIGFLLFTLRIIGGGDVKLIAALTLSLPNDQIPSLFFFITFSGLLVIIVGFLFYRKAITDNGVPYGVAISLGYLVNMCLYS
ncbi:flp operon protein B [Lonepinella koalarum]|uniref:Prepilin peptidase CpaA n=1 Tax=Lonepinella koalarum TaxID=53417 RepID=A0A4R1KZA5_9PAST|nr:prepilin peptidase [Lonepinella koalarum]MDH2927804.1 flp operon protein B [Lonepinella koalarum]TCK69997.1 prepilin peptidase CpaA [Lonepinella koalarum]TFJ90400.1 flp operon protein B [Lonepinella koalarum]TYG35097.1 flp operon protein B [Lonepinella koalarum]